MAWAGLPLQKRKPAVSTSRSIIKNYHIQNGKIKNIELQLDKIVESLRTTLQIDEEVENTLLLQVKRCDKTTKSSLKAENPQHSICFKSSIYFHIKLAISQIGLNEYVCGPTLAYSKILSNLHDQFERRRCFTQKEVQIDLKIMLSIRWKGCPHGHLCILLSVPKNT